MRASAMMGRMRSLHLFSNDRECPPMQQPPARPVQCMPRRMQHCPPTRPTL